MCFVFDAFVRCVCVVLRLCVLLLFVHVRLRVVFVCVFGLFVIAVFFGGCVCVLFVFGISLRSLCVRVCFWVLKDVVVCVMSCLFVGLFVCRVLFFVCVAVCL